MKKLITAFIVILTTFALRAQHKFFTKSGNISFLSKTALESIEANHKSVTCILDTKTGNMQFAVLVKGFEFEKALMQEHFNENYVESHKFPKSEFKGTIVNNADINYAKEGIYTAQVKGKLTIHGETNDVEANGKMEIRGGKIYSSSSFTILLSDYKIEIPKIVNDKVSNTLKIEVNCPLELLKS